MTTTSNLLGGLPLELRRAAKTTEKIADIFVRIAGEKNQREVFELKWVPAVLVEKEMRGLKLRLQNELAKELNKESNSLSRDELLLRLIDKVEGALGK